MGVGAGPGHSGSDHLRILSGTSQNVVGLGVAAVAMLGAQVMMTRALGAPGFGIVTVVTQAAFVLSFATRSGMDMAVLRGVAVEAGVGRYDRVREHVRIAVLIAFGVSTVIAMVGVVGASTIRSLLSIDPERGRYAVEVAALGLPFLALANVWLAATRGLKIMRYTLYIFWAGQPLGWIVLMVAGWTVSRTPWMSALAYSASWAVAAPAAWWSWRRESRSWDAAAMGEGELRALLRYAGPRAPAALFAQLLFWTDLFVLTRYVADSDVGIYSAALRAGQVVVLFLTSVNLMFSPYVADLHNRGEIERLNRLFKTLTRWTLAATVPGFLLIGITPDSVLGIFGAEFGDGKAALLILIAGQAVNVATGSVGFVLIMVGRTGWDLAVYAFSLVLDVTLAIVLASRYGIEGAAAANAITFTVSNLLRLFLVYRFVGIQPYDRNYLRIIAPALAAAVAMWGVHRAGPEAWAPDVALTAAVGAAVYAAAYAAVGLTPRERAGARRLLAGREGAEGGLSRR